MSRFDVYPGPAIGGIGNVHDVQADLPSDLETRVAVPLLPPEHAPTPARTLNPTFTINGQPHLMLTQFLATVPARHLKQPVLSLATRSDDITRALDLLLIGF